MGYSCTIKAMESFDQLIIQLKAAGKEIKSSNGWEKNGIEYFHEIGRENRDGSVTGSVTKIYDVENRYCRKAGTFRVEPDGKITRFPTSTKIQREVAEIAAKAEIEERGNIFSVSR